MIGQVLHHYRIREKIGAGGMGVVYRADDIRLGRTVALKMLATDCTHDAELQRRLAREARAASALTHPGVAAVYDYQEHETGNYIVFEFVEGTTLRDWGLQHRCTLAELLNVAVQLADTVAAAHERSIIHRDLKPANIMLTPGPDPPGRIKILDFGLAKISRAPFIAFPDVVNVGQTASLSTTAGMLVGTVTYMSPEQVEAAHVDVRSDLYSLGLVLYELATGVTRSSDTRFHPRLPTF